MEKGQSQIKFSFHMEEYYCIEFCTFRFDQYVQCCCRGKIFSDEKNLYLYSCFWLCISKTELSSPLHLIMLALACYEDKLLEATLLAKCGT